MFNFEEDEKPTQTGSSRLRALRLTDPPVLQPPSEPKSVEELIGELMAVTVSNTSSVNNLSEQVNLLSRELGQHVRDQTHKTDEIKETTNKAARHGSNRLALLMGALFTLYEVTAPWLHELAQMVRK